VGPIPAVRREWWGSNLVAEHVSLAVFGLVTMLILAVLAWTVRRDLGALTTLAVGLVLVGAVGAISSQVALRFAGHTFLVILACSWAYSSRAPLRNASGPDRVPHLVVLS